MNSISPEFKGNESRDWKASDDLQTKSSDVQSSEIPSTIPSNIGKSIPSHILDDSNLMEKPINTRLITLTNELLEMTKLFNKSRAIDKESRENPLVPLKSDNANDVYIPEGKGLVFKPDKPGMAATIKSKICSGLLTILKSLEGVIPLTKHSQATVISREDYGVTRTPVFNPEDDHLYVIDTRLKQVTLEDIKKNNNVIEGKIGEEHVKLMPIDGQSGFYRVQVLEKDGNRSKEEVSDTTSTDDDNVFSKTSKNTSYSNESEINSEVTKDSNEELISGSSVKEDGKESGESDVSSEVTEDSNDELIFSSKKSDKMSGSSEDKESVKELGESDASSEVTEDSNDEFIFSSKSNKTSGLSQNEDEGLGGSVSGESGDDYFDDVTESSNEFDSYAATSDKKNSETPWDDSKSSSESIENIEDQWNRLKLSSTPSDQKNENVPNVKELLNISKKNASNEEVFKKTKNDDSFDEISSDDEDKLNNRIVMHCSSSLPTQIDGWVKEGASWTKLKVWDKLNKTETSVLAPSKAIIEIVEIKTHVFEEEECEPIINTNENNSKKVPKENFLVHGVVVINNNNYSIIIKEDNAFELHAVKNTSGQKFETTNESKEVAANYKLVNDSNDKLGLVLNNNCLKFNENLVTCEGKEYSVKKQIDETFLLQKEVKDINNKEKFVILEYDDQEKFLKKDRITMEHGIKSVIRNKLNYEVIITEDKPIQVVGKNIKGSAQLKVDNLFTTKKPLLIKNPNESKKETLDLMIDSPKLEKFYNHIHMPSFIQAFIATILLRPQDGKICSNVGDGNFLFQIMSSSNEKSDDKPFDEDIFLNSVDQLLRILMIDLDETMPSDNAYTENPKFKKRSPKIHAIRNGLMGFPQASRKLSGEEKTIVLDILNEIFEKEEDVCKFLNQFKSDKPEGSFTEKNVEAYKDIVGKLKTFVDKPQTDWSLQDLFFFVFPEYEEQWKKLGDSFKPQEKAQYIGNDPVEHVLKLKELRSKK